MNILLTSVGRRSYLVNYFREALNGKGKVYVANSSEVSPAFQCADESIVTPLIYDEKYIPFLIEYCKNNKINVVISLFDVDLPILAKNKKKFEEIGVNLIVSDYEFVEKCNDKWKTFLFLKDNGFNVPNTFIDIQTVEKELENNNLNFPLIIKPRWGMGSIGIFEADNIEELKIFYKKTINQIKKSYLKYESVEDIEHSVLIQEKIKGDEYGLDIINDLNFDYINTVVKKKYAMRSGETDCAVTVDNVEIKKLGKKLSSISKHIANLDVDVFVSGNKIYVLEMNARFGGGYPFSYMAGVNLPLAIIKWVNGEKVDKKLLSEKINVLSHKDISLVNIDLAKFDIIQEEEEVYRLINTFSEELVPTLRERNIDIESYSHKLYSFGKLISISYDSRIVGVLGIYMNNYETKEAYISFLAVDSKYQSNGYGKKLLQYAEALVHDNGMKSIRLQVRNSNVRGINFYTRNGYLFLKHNKDEGSYFLYKRIEG